MSHPRKPSETLERTGAFRQNPQRRRVDPEAPGAVPEFPPDHLGLDEYEAQAWVDIAGALAEVKGVGKHADWISVEAAARALGKIRRGNWTDGALGQLRMFLTCFGLTPAGRAALATPAPQKPKNEKIAQFVVQPKGQGAAKGDRTN